MLDAADSVVLTERKLKITVLAGGPSAERAVSLESGAAIADALRRRGHGVNVADIGPDDLSALEAPADLVFPALHGTFGEDGTLQRILEQRGIRFVGSGARASTLAMDKLAAKRIVEQLGLDTPEYELVGRKDLERYQPKFAPPVVVKPIDQGSSVLTTICHDEAARRDALTQVVERFGKALVERFIAGQELTVGIVGELTLPPIVIRPKRAFYDYDAKYHDDATEYLFEAGLPDDVLDRAGAISWQVFDALGCRHLARVDWILDAAERLWFLEVNTIPGFTSHSLVPKAAAHVNVPFDELVERLALMALGDAT